MVRLPYADSNLTKHVFLLEEIVLIILMEEIYPQMQDCFYKH